LSAMLQRLSGWWHTRGVTPAALAAYRRDVAGLGNSEDPGLDVCIDSATGWLCDAQDNSVSQDGGVARDYSLLSGWAASYPETTGYIVPTMLRVSQLRQRHELRERAARMLDWCVGIQLPCGGFQGGRVDSEPVVPVTFNTGQVLLGLAAGVAAFGRYEEAMHRAARFLRDSQDADGCWRQYPTPFAAPGEKAYETHVAWGLFEADRRAPDEGYGAAGWRQVQWALTKQQPNGWVRDCCLNRPEAPLTHTLGYYLKGLVEAYRWRQDERLLAGALLTARGLASAQRPDGALPGRLSRQWRAAVSWTCLTGNVQIADSWLYLGEVVKDVRLINAAREANRFVRRSLLLIGDVGERGGIKGAFPVHGDYGRYEYLNWAAKFAIDSWLTERELGH
jgi:hypothetical protein